MHQVRAGPARPRARLPESCSSDGSRVGVQIRSGRLFVGVLDCVCRIYAHTSSEIKHRLLSENACISSTNLDLWTTVSTPTSKHTSSPIRTLCNKARFGFLRIVHLVILRNQPHGISCRLYALSLTGVAPGEGGADRLTCPPSPHQTRPTPSLYFLFERVVSGMVPRQPHPEKVILLLLAKKSSV